MEKETGYNRATEIVHFPVCQEGNKDPYNASSVPIYQSATFKQTSSSDNSYDYTRSGNPTRSAVQQHLSVIMKAKHVYLVSTGMSALDVILRATVKTGQEVIAGDDLYGGTNRLLTHMAEYSGVKTHHVDTTKAEQVSTKLDVVKTRLVLLESPTNPKCQVADIPQIARLAHECQSTNGTDNSNGVLVVVDNTMMSPYLQNTLELGADIEYHSGTKFLSGHHDLMAGVIATNNDELANKLYFIINSIGCGLSPFDSWLLHRGIKTLSIRVEKQQANAIQIANFLESQLFNGIKFKVNYPGLASHPQYNLHKSMSSGPGAVLSFTTGDVGISERIVENTRLWSISVSFGCVNSLISMPTKMSHASIPAEIRKQRMLDEDLIRLCVGIEHVDDLINDLKQAILNAI
ncbi:Cystathionine beta-lyase [Zancudomyces culisetae]|uniref:Cystathionine beta-lyase n=1 Tax=Zancudomyces culisetae TaxID=1213189 RepID=A0A1R1PE73_ZANCU|nr:Cystathionine beta-lyase [Zancudomyces culisetae]|eukprot:OMH79203.1 Cystathionine beta-lyase [Zancudomyces culisetae]